MEILHVLRKAFDARSWDFLKKNTQWQEHSEEPAISRAIIESSGYKQGMLCKLEGGLNVLDFLTVWRVVASGVDKLIFTGISLETQCLVMVGWKGFMLIGVFCLLFFKHGV